MFQSAAASWTRRNHFDRQKSTSPASFNPPPRRGRGGIRFAWTSLAGLVVSIRRRVVDAAESERADELDFVDDRFNPPPRRGRGGIWRPVRKSAPGTRFNPPPRRGRGGIIVGTRVSPCWSVSIRRRVVDAAE